MKYSISIEGMGCMHCVKKVKDTLENMNVKVISCEIGSAQVEYDGKSEDIKSAIENVGYKVKEIV